MAGRHGGTAQWQKPWPDVEGRDARVRRGLDVGGTWMVGRRGRSLRPGAESEHGTCGRLRRTVARDEPAVYAHRLIVDRQFAGFGLGAELIDWTELYGQREWGAEWIRMDAWTTNRALHGYLMDRGFEPAGPPLTPTIRQGCSFRSLY